MPDYSNTRIQVRRGSSSQWAAANTILSSGEPGIDQNSGVFKVGDGVTGWNALSGVNFNQTHGGGGGGGGISNVVEDTSPQLGGNLDMNSRDLTGTGDIDITGSGRFTHAAAKCGLVLQDTLGSGIHLGDCALGGNGGFAGMKHSDYNMTTDYMIVSDGTDTYISAKDTGAVYIRPGGNAGEGGITISDVGAGAVGTVFNEAGANRDLRMEGASEANLFRIDASTDSIGIKSAVPSHSLSVSGTLNANEIFISGATAVQTSPTLAKSSGSLNVSGINNLVFTDLAGHSGIAVKDTQTLYFIVNN